MSTVFQKKFDRVISLGATCACAMYLRKSYLRDASYPFDWLCESTFTKRIDLILSNFENFLCYDNLTVARSRYCEEYKHLPHIGVKDSATGLMFLHDFTDDSQLKDDYPVVSEKYNRRIKRLYKSVGESKNVLFVFWAAKEIVSDDLIVQAQQKLSEFFRKEISILVISHEENLNNQRDVCLSEYAMRVFTDLYVNVDPREYLGYYPHSIVIFKKNHKVGIKRKRLMVFAVYVLSQLIPVKNVRRGLRSKLYKRLGLEGVGGE